MPSKQLDPTAVFNEPDKLFKREPAPNEVLFEPDVL